MVGTPDLLLLNKKDPELKKKICYLYYIIRYVVLELNFPLLIFEEPYYTLCVIQ